LLGHADFHVSSLDQLAALPGFPVGMRLRE
jgi:hypothetical protein